ncbi:MAG: response regulator [Sphingomonas sp.]|jgi:FixJ family two-component response regulator|uniref:response regulator n=1 Tax=Sphingomonas sp. TaxID=28214 RepID=UPI003564628D
MVTRNLVSVVDDDEYVREALPDLLRSFGLESQSFASAAAFLASESLDRTGCLILDVTMPGMTGPELQLELARRRCDIPIVFITADADESLGPRMLRRGAVAFLKKPFSEAAMIEAVNAALDSGRDMLCG